MFRLARQRVEGSEVVLAVNFRPLEQRLELPRGGQKRSPFSGSFTDTLNRLEREMDLLRAKDIVIQIDTALSDIRNDGWPRSTAKVNSHGVVLTFASSHGPLSYRCNTYIGWEQNLRAIAMTLERLRAIERYGAVKGGQQYRGWSQLPPGSNGNGPIQAGEWANVEQAAKFLWITAGWPEEQLEAVQFRRAVTDAKILDGVYRDAAKEAHPDKGGTNDLMSKVNRARDFIEKNK